MSNPFFERPILNSPYAYPVRHWELDEQRRIRDEINAARALEGYEAGFSREATEQAARLASVGIFEGMPPGEACPLCSRALDDGSIRSSECGFPKAAQVMPDWATKIES